MRNIIIKTLPFIFISMTASVAEPPAPLPLSIPKAGAEFVVQSATQIEKLTLKNTALAPVSMPAPFGRSYTLAFWVRFDDSPALAETEFTKDAPVTLVDLYSNDINAQRTTLRIQGGKFAANVMNDKKSKALPGIGMAAEPGRWYFLAYTCDNGQGVFYVNGDRALRTPPGSPVQSDLQNIAFGHFQKGRRLDGVILRPRLYPATLAAAELNAIQSSEAPLEAKEAGEAKNKPAEPNASQPSEVPAWAKESKEQKNKRMEWWRHDRFGMFIHWGIYALPARGEWVKKIETISDGDYQKYFDNFNPDLYNPQEWAKKAKDAGMKYVVLTAKHHDGFCLWDSKYTDYKATSTACGKDLVRLLVDAFRAEGLRIGFYYSLLDWHHPHFTYDRLHPSRPRNAGDWPKANEKRDMNIYRRYMKDQLAELLSNYGPIDELFLDFSYATGKDGKGHKDWDSEGLLKLIRSLQPQIIIDDRADLKNTEWGWDYVTPEKTIPNEWPKENGVRVPWETCQTFSGAWGYHRDEHTWKSVRQLVVMLLETVSKGGNLLLNVGPTARGIFDDRANDRLEGIAKWMKLHGRAIYGCTQAPDEYKAPGNCFLTHNPETKRLYLHMLEWPVQPFILPGYEGKIKYAQLLNDASEIRHRENNGDIILSLPVVRPNVEVPVVELILD
jgi:alpha-L-fucosidase